ncbi:MAG TPA: hypothetical protein PLP05_02935, partial [Sedimentisphaerales bacterium]|nr:hypothetical protein [Sedimentisphaerales bacterium]
NKKSKAELGFFMIHDYIWIECGDSSSVKQGETGSSLTEGKKEALYFGNEVPEKNAYYGFVKNSFC